MFNLIMQEPGKAPQTIRQFERYCDAQELRDQYNRSFKSFLSPYRCHIEEQDDTR